MDSEQIGMWLDSIDDYGMGDGRYWIPTKEGFEELCRLALRGGLAAPEEGFPHLDQEPLDFAAALSLLREARAEIARLRSAPEGDAIKLLREVSAWDREQILNYDDAMTLFARLHKFVDGLTPQNGNTK